MNLTTPRSFIKTITLNDAPFFQALTNSPGWLKYIGNRGTKTLEDTENYLKRSFLKCYEDHGFGYYLITTKENHPIGICGFLKKPTLEYEDFGFAFLPEYCGQGYALEASQAVLDYGIQTYGFQTLDAVTQSDNLKSKRLLEKLNFKYQRILESENDSTPLELYRWSN